MDGGDNSAHGSGQGFSNATLSHESLLMGPALPKYPSKLDGLNHTHQVYTYGTILVASSVWVLCSGILHSIIGCSLLNILRPCSGLKTSGNEHPVTESNIPEERVFVTALPWKPKNLQVQCDLWFWVTGKKKIRTNAIMWLSLPTFMWTEWLD
jgi:hypothetical protein